MRDSCIECRLLLLPVASKYTPDPRKRVFFTSTTKPDPRKLPGLHNVLRAEFPDGRVVYKFSIESHSGN